MKKLCVIGSFNIDIIAKTNTLPELGETVRCSDFELFVGGGKGANQAVAAGRLGADVMMVGRLGERFYGPEYLRVLSDNGVDASCVDVLPDRYPGRAFVASDANGDNVLFIHPGTNELVDIDYIDRHWQAISSCDLFLLQFEIPFQTNRYLIERLHAAGKTILLDPAPVTDVPKDLWPKIDYVTPNEIELRQLTGMPTHSLDAIQAAAQELLSMGARCVVAKAGKNGACGVTHEGCTLIPAARGIKAIDTTAAGDSFNAGLAYRLAQGASLNEAISFANVVGGLSTTKIGAQNAMPTHEEVLGFIEAVGKG